MRRKTDLEQAVEVAVHGRKPLQHVAHEPDKQTKRQTQDQGRQGRQGTPSSTSTPGTTTGRLNRIVRAPRSRADAAERRINRSDGKLGTRMQQRARDTRTHSRSASFCGCHRLTIESADAVSATHEHIRRGHERNGAAHDGSRVAGRTSTHRSLRRRFARATQPATTQQRPWIPWTQGSWAQKLPIWRPSQRLSHPSPNQHRHRQHQQRIWRPCWHPSSCGGRRQT